MQEMLTGVEPDIPNFPVDREEADLFAAEATPSREKMEESLSEFRETIDELVAKRTSPSLTGQKIIHSLTRARIRFAADLPMREDILTEVTKQTIELLNEFEIKSRAILDENLASIFPTKPESTIQGLIDGATAEECAIRMVGLAAPDSKLFYPNDEDEHNGVDFIIVTDRGSLAVQVKVIRYRENVESRMPLLYTFTSQEEISEICATAMDPSSLDYGQGTDTGIIFGRVMDSLQKNLRYVSQFPVSQQIRSAFMPISTKQLNPRISEKDVYRLEKSGLIPID